MCFLLSHFLYLHDHPLPQPQAANAQSHRQHLIEQGRAAFAKKKAEEAAGVSAKKGTGRECEIVGICCLWLFAGVFLVGLDVAGGLGVDGRGC